MGIGFAEGTFEELVQTIISDKRVDLLVCVALGVDMVRELHLDDHESP